MRIKYHIPVILWSLGIFFVMIFPGNYVPKPQGIWQLLSYDKLIHLTLFAPLSYLLARSFKFTGLSIKRSILVSLLFGIIYAIFTELLQLYIVVGRNGNVYDAIADIAGVFLGVFVFYKKHKIVE